MARRGGRRGRRSRSRQNRSRRSSSRTRSSRRTTTRRSAPSSRRNTRTTTRASNRRATVSKARRAAPKRAPAPKKKATTRRAAPSNRRATVSKQRQQQRATQTAPKKAVNASANKPATSKRQATRINRTTPVKASTAFNNALKSIQNRNLVAQEKRRINPFNIFQTREAIKEGDAAREGKRPTVTDKPGLFDRMLNRNSETQRMIDQASAGNTRLAVSGNVSNLGVGKDVTPFKINPASSYGYPSQAEVDNAALSGGGGFIGRKPTGNPNVMSADGTFNRPGPGGPEPESDYTSYKPGSFYNLSDTNMNPTNFMRSTRNVITTPFRALGINNRLTNKLIPKSNEAIQDARDQRGPRRTLKRRGGSGGASRIEQQVAAQQIQPEIAPTIGTPPAEEYIESAAPQGDLTRIQNQAYNTQLTSNLSSMLGQQGSVGYTPQGSQALSPTLRAGRSRGRRRVRLFGGRRRRGGTGDQFSRAGDRIARLTNINI